MTSLNRMFKDEPRDIGFELKKMVVKNGSDSMVEAFLIVLRNCRRLRELVSNQVYFEFLKANFKDQKALQPIVALFNFICSSYTVDLEAKSEEISKLLTQIRKEHAELADTKKTNDIELLLLAISSSFRYLSIMMQIHGHHLRTFEEVIADLLKQDEDTILRVKPIRVLIDAIFADLRTSKKDLPDSQSHKEKLKILKGELQTVTYLLHSQDKAPHSFKEMNFFCTLADYDDEENELFNELIRSFGKKQFDSFGNHYINTKIFKPIPIEFLKEDCKMNRYDLQNQVNFSYVHTKFDYLSNTRTISCNLIGTPTTIHSKKEDCDQQSMHSRITYTNKMTVKTKDFKQNSEVLRLPKIKNYLLKVMELDPNMDILNDYDVIAYFQVTDPKNSVNYYRFVSVEDRITSVISGEVSSSFNIMFLNEKRLCLKNAIKVFYSTKFSKGTIMNDPKAMCYVSLDNDELLSFFVEHVIKAHGLNEGSKDDTKALVTKMIDKMCFYMPSTVGSEEEVIQWKNWSKELKLTKDTPLSEIYEKLSHLSGITLLDDADKGKHMFLSCYINSEDADLQLNTKQFEQGGFENFEKKGSDKVQLNTGLTDIFDYLLSNFRLTLTGSAEKNDAALEAIQEKDTVWSIFNKYTPRLLLPTYLIVNVFELRKLLELGDDLDFDYLDEKIKNSQDPLSTKYSLVAIICQKKNVNPLCFYPCIREQSTTRLDSKTFKGFIGDAEKLAPAHKIDREMVHFLVFEREIIQFK